MRMADLDILLKAGKRKWWEKTLDIACWMGVLLCLLYGAFMGGRYFEGVTLGKALTKCHEECEMLKVKEKVAYHGKGNFYFKDRGQLYFVKDANDLEKESKWIKVR